MRERKNGLGKGFAKTLLLGFGLATWVGCPQPAGPIKADDTEPGKAQGAPVTSGAGQDEQVAFGGPPAGRNVPGQFDFYVLSLSWSPQHCATRGRQLPPDDPQCGGSAAFGFIVHGLWPQYQQGYPQSCAPPQELDAALIKRVLRIMPSEKLIRHEWEKHGTCSGLQPADYFGRAESLRDGLKVPERFAAPSEPVATTMVAFRQEFIAGNPGMPADGSNMAVICAGEYLTELRLCYTKDFKPQACSADVHDTCGASFSARPLNPRRTQ